ncbi:MAG: rhomboid family intramembrane serine protease [Pseudomonadota bacterium]
MEETKPKNPPAFNVPAVLLALVVLLLVIHGITVLALDRDGRAMTLLLFAFIPGFYSAEAADLFAPMSRYWTPVSYAFLHGDWTHVGINCAYLIAFGTPVARRFGAIRFLTLMFAGALGGAAAHYFAHANALVPMVGASASVSAALGAAARFALAPGVAPARSVYRPALSLGASLANRGVMTFVVVWFALNWVFGSGIIAIPGNEAGIAWEAHVGGFLVGWLAFGLFDPIPRIPSVDED